MKISIVTYEWVNSVWETNLENYVPATEKVYDKYKCPIFLNLIVTTTSLPKTNKELVKQLINNNGGVNYSILYFCSNSNH